MEQTEVLQLIQKAKKAGAEHLDLSNHEITQLPEEIGQLKQLRYLNLGYNQLEVLPGCIRDLTHLEELYLLRNKLSELPVGLEALKKLRVLDLSFNKFKMLPDSFGNFECLEFLDASFCKVERLPISLVQLIGLKHLVLDENPLIFPPQKVVKRGLYATMHYLLIEKRKIESSNVAMHVINMPERLQMAFKKYLQLFGKMVAKANHKELSLDVSFLNHNLYHDVDVEVGLEDTIMEWLRKMEKANDLAELPKETKS